MIITSGGKFEMQNKKGKTADTEDEQDEQDGKDEEGGKDDNITEKKKNLV